MTGNETEEFSAFINAMTEDEIQQDKEILDASTFFRTTSASSTNSTVRNVSNVSFSVIFEDQLDDDDAELADLSLSLEQKDASNVKAKMDETTLHTNLFQGRKQTKNSNSNKEAFSKEKNPSSQTSPGLSHTLSEEKMQILFQSLCKQCSVSGFALVSGELPGSAELLQMAIGAINLLKEKEEKKRQEKKVLKEEQAMMLKKLIDLLKESSSMNNINNEVMNSSLQEFDQYHEMNEKKFNFYGFRSRKPVYRDNIGRFTAERLFQSSPPLFPTPPAEDSSAETLHDLSELEFVFKPAETTFAAMKNHLCVKKLLNKKEDAKKSKAGLKNYLNGRQSKATGVPIQEGKRGPSNTCNQKRVTMNHLVKASKKGKTRRSVNHVWATNLTRKKKRKETFSVKRQQVRRKKDTTEEGSHCILDGSSHVANKQSKANKHWSLTSPKGTFKTLSSLAKANAFSLNSENSKFSKLSAWTKTLSEGAAFTPEAELKVSSIGAGTKMSSRSQIVNKKNVLIQKPKKKIGGNRKSKKAHLAQNNSFLPVVRARSRSSINKDLVYSLSSTSQFKYIGESNRSKCEAHKEPSVYPKIIENQFGTYKSQEMPQLFYPVHPYTSDLPVHFIPIDPQYVPNYFPLYYPTFGMKSTTDVFPSFVQAKMSGLRASSRSKYIFTNGIMSSSLPHQTLTVEEVYPRILPGILSNSACPLVPDINQYKPVSGNPIHIKNALGNPQTETSFYKTGVAAPTAVVSGTPKAHNPARPVQDLTSPSTTLIAKPQNAHPKIHKCTKCSFESPKLGVLKRHQLSHSKTNSFPLNPSDEVHILDSKIDSICVPRQAVRPSLPSNAAGDQTIRVSQVPSGHLYDSDESDIKIESTESLKKSFAIKNPFHGFSGASRNELFEKRFPSITITPLIHLQE